MRMRTKVWGMIWLGLLFVLLPIEFFTFRTANSYFKQNFYRSVAPVLKASSLSLQTDIVRGSALSTMFTQNVNVINWVESNETAAEDESIVKAAMIELSKNPGFATTFLAIKSTGSYYVVENGQVIRDQLYKNEPKDAWFYTILDLPDVTAYNLDYNKTLDQTLFWFDTKVYNKAGTPIGLAGVAIDLSSAVTMLREDIPSKNSWIGLADSAGLVSISSNESMLNKNLSDVIPQNLTSIPGYDGLKRYRTQIGYSVFAQKQLWTTPYNIVLSMPEKDFIPSGLDVLGVPLLVGIIIAVAIIFVTAFITQAIFRKFDQLQRAMKQIASLDLTPVLESSSTDEIAKINSYVNTALQDIRVAITEVKNESVSMNNFAASLLEHITKSSGDIMYITDDISTVVNSIEQQSDDVSAVGNAIEVVLQTLDNLNRRIEVQATNVSESTAAITQMVSNIQSVTDILNRNKQSFTHLEDASKSALEATDQTAAVVQKIFEDSEGLLEAISVIQNIATQTNLLAMNAAIEAAHAGDAGKGFSVVADEIRKLAEESSSQGKNISVVLKNLKTEIENVTGHSAAMQKAFSEIATHTDIFKNQESTILAAMQEQSAGSGQILKAMAEISEITNEVKSSSNGIIDHANDSNTKIMDLMHKTDEIKTVMSNINGNANKVVQTIQDVNNLTEQNARSIKALSEHMNKFKT